MNNIKRLKMEYPKKANGYPHVKNLGYYEKMIHLYEEGVIKLSLDEVIDLGDEILGFNFDDWSLHSVRERYKLACGIESALECETCQLFGNGCDYSEAIGLAVYIYGNLVRGADGDRELLWNYLEERIQYRLI